jgi:hypothetical protein
MPTNKKLDRRYVTGITPDPSVHAYLDDLAARSRTSRSWVLNSIVYEYVMLVEKTNLVPLAASLKAPQSTEPVIKFDPSRYTVIADRSNSTR